MALYAAVNNVELVQTPETLRREYQVAADPGTVHAIAQRRPALTQTNFFDRPQDAVCGAKVRAQLPVLFRADDPDACEKCSVEGYRDETRTLDLRVRPDAPSDLNKVWTSETPA